LSSNDSGLFSFRFVDVHSRTVRDWQRNQFFEVPINHAQRTTAPPCHFAEKWRLPCSFLMSSELKALLADPEVGDVDSSLTKLQRLSNAIITQYELLHDRYPHPLEMN
jgi:hypothetical protein